MPEHRERASAFKGSSQRLFAELISPYSSQQGQNGCSTHVLLLGTWEERSFMTTNPPRRSFFHLGRTIWF